MFVYKWYRKVFEEEVTPFILDIEEQAKHQDHVHHGDHDDNNHAAVNGHPVLLFCPPRCHSAERESLHLTIFSTFVHPSS